MTIVPKEWEARGLALPRGAAMTRLRATLVALGLLCVAVGVAVLAQGHMSGLAGVLFGAGYLARATTSSSPQGRRRAGRAARE